MLRLITLCIIITVWFEPTWAQNIEWSNPQKIKNKTLYTQVLGETQSGIFLLRCKDNEFSNGLIIEKYKQNLSLDASTDLPITINGLVERVLLIDNFIFAFIAAKNNNTGNVDVLVQKIDEALKPVGMPTVLGSIPADQYIDKRHIQVKTSSNKSQIALMFLTKNQQTGILNLWLYNKQMQQVYAKQFNLGQQAKDVYVTNYEVTNQGNAFVLIDYPKVAAQNKKSDPRQFFLFGYYLSTDRMLQYAIGNDSLFVEDFTLTANNYNNTVNVFGFYAKPGIKGLAGYFYYRINAQTAVLEQRTFNALDYWNFYATYVGRLGEKQQDLSDFYIRKIIPRSDGGILALAEKYYQTRQVYTYYINNFPQTTTRTIFHYDEAPLINIEPTGEITDIKWIKKAQSSSNDGGYLLSYTTVPTTEAIHCVYNYDNGNDNDIYISSFAFDGKFDAKILVKSSSFNAAIIPTEYKQLNEKTVLICTIKDKRFALMRITF